MRKRLLIGAASAVMCALSATAQESAVLDASADESVDEDSETLGLGVVYVTAQRRQENIQSAAVAVDVADGEALREKGVTDLARLSEFSSALEIQPSSSGNSIFMRGVGNFTLTANSDPATSFNYDGVYVGRPSSTFGVFYDLARVEVLKGPQGILYGRNATGGAINVIPNRPELSEFSGYAAASFGNYDTILGEGAANLPVGDSAAVRLSASYSKRNGYLNDGTSDDDTVGFRLQYLTELTPDLSVRLSGDFSQSHGVGVGVSYVGSYGRNPPAVGGYTFRPGPLGLDEGIYTDAAQAYRVTLPAGTPGRPLDEIQPYPNTNQKFGGVHAEVTYETGLGTFTFLPAWRRTQNESSNVAAGFASLNGDETDEYGLELRLNGNRVGIVDYTVGLYYFDQTIDGDSVINLSALGAWIDSTYKTESFAPFGSATFNFTDDFRITAGARWTQDAKEYSADRVNGNIVCTTLPVPCPAAPLFQTLASPDDQPFAFPASSGVTIIGGAAVSRSDAAASDKLSDDQTTYRLAVEYDLGSQSLFYVSYETGYRSGGFSTAEGFETYEPEYLDAYTVGIKNRLFSDRVQVNLEAFYWEYSNQQVSHVGVDLAGRTAQFIENIGESTIQGVDIQGIALLTPSVTVRANLQYLDSVNDSFIYQQSAAPPSPPPLTGCDFAVSASNPALYDVDCSGLPGYNSPEWTIGFGAEKLFELGDYELTVGLDTRYKSERYIGFNYLPEQMADENWLSNANVALARADSDWEIAAFVRNIEDERVPTFAPVHPRANILVNGTSAPRTYGVRLSRTF